MRITRSALAAAIALVLAAPAGAAPPIAPLTAGAANPRAVVREGAARFEVLSPTLIRMEYADDGAFEDRPTMTAIRRRLAVPRFRVRRTGGELVIRTAKVTLRYRIGSGAFGPSNLTLVLRAGPTRTTVHPDAARNPAPLGGWRRSLDLADGPADLHPGLLAREGWHVLDDTTTVTLAQDAPGYAVRAARQGAYRDLYLFAYGHDYARGLKDLRDLAGPAPLLPRKAFGVWFSRYWPYSDGELRDLVAHFRSAGVPLDTLSLDTDFKRVADPVGAAIAAQAAGAPGKPYSWNGWEWNASLFPDPAGFVRWAHGEGIALALNVHPSIDSNDPRFAETQAKAGGGLKPDDGCRVVQADTTGTCNVFDWTDPRQLDAYFALHEPFEREGIDVWWLDWCCDPTKADAPGLTPDTFINWRYAQRQRDRGSRWPAFQRIGASYQLGFGGDGGIGAFAEHRSTIQFTGDTCATWPMLGFEPEFTAAEGAIGLPYVSHDIGSFHSVSPLGVCDKTASPLLTPEVNSLPDDMYARWVQLGAFQPLLRLHSHHGKRLPWEYGEAAGTSATDFLKLREALVPYLYTVAREAVDRGLPMARALYLQWAEQDGAYRHPGEYTLGRDVLVAPVAQPGDPAQATVWIPPGTWYDWFTGEAQSGPKEITVSVPLSRMPVYVRAGAIVPTQPDAPTTPGGSPASLILTAHPGNGRFRLYDDAGDGLDYLDGRSGRVTISQRRRGRTVRLTIGRERGSFAALPARRSWELRIRGVARPGRVLIGSRRARDWSYDARSETVTVRTGALPVRRTARIVLRG